MKKIVISLILLGFVALYVGWHLIYRGINHSVNTTDNLAIENKYTNKLPFKWLRSSYLTKNNSEQLIEEKEECYSLYELQALYSAENDAERLRHLCDTRVENAINEYKISASCQNQSARFYVEIEWQTFHSKWHEWQQTIFDINHSVIQQERITFQQQGTCDVTN